MNNIALKRSYTLPNWEYPRPFSKSKGNIHDLFRSGTHSLCLFEVKDSLLDFKETYIFKVSND